MNLAPKHTRGGNNFLIVLPAAVHLFSRVDFEIKSADEIEQVPDSQLEVRECACARERVCVFLCQPSVLLAVASAAPCYLYWGICRKGHI